ncbi:MAG: sensor histidine kinase N-terminal domain-containing protein [Burkholderiales bacterium]|nr:sensor histidine kinase N-terminal domain-containing protein [Burkholderiales bacterium]
MNTVLPHSLRARLLLFLLVAVIVTTLLQALVAYRSALIETDEIFDYQMQKMAASLRPGLVTSAAEFDPDPNIDAEIEFVVQVWTSEGLRVFRSTAKADLPQRAVLGFSNIETHGTTYRIFSLATGNQVVQIAQELTARQKMAGKLALRTVAPIGLVAPLLMLLVWWVITTSLSPVDRVRRQVASRHADTLTEVSEDGLPDEIVPLVQELNLLFKRVRQAFEAQQRFVADAAHELRSPLAALKLQVQGLRRAHDDSSKSLAVERLTAGIDRATRLVEQLLVLARQQARVAEEIPLHPVDLRKVAQFVLADLWEVARQRQIDIGIDGCEDGYVNGQEDALQILIRNLVDNAIKYTPKGGVVNISLSRGENHIFLKVEDSGPGIPEQDHKRIFDRFYRLADTRTSGSGLGLSIVKTIADMLVAHVSIGRSAHLGGLEVTVAFEATQPLHSPSV